MFSRILGQLVVRRVARLGSLRHAAVSANGPSLKDFVNKTVTESDSVNSAPNLSEAPFLAQYLQGNGRKIYMETYGCQMNFSDSEIVRAVMQENGFANCDSVDDADIVFLMTCAIREGAESKVFKRLDELHALKKRPRGRPVIGLLGCMAERLKGKLVEMRHGADVVAGPDAYRSLPLLLSRASSGQDAVNVMLSVDETYADIKPVRTDGIGVSAFVSIMRGCNNMCSFCIVPFTRGRERSRPVTSIVDEVRSLREQGYKEVVLLGQNVNSYADTSVSPSSEFATEPTHSAGMKSLAKPPEHALRFAELLHHVASAADGMRVRFTSPHPQHFPDAVLHAIREHHNICVNIHLPAQSGSTSVLARMRRGYSRESYIELADRIRSLLPG